MKVAQGIKSQIGGIAKGTIKQILQEPSEILKDVGEQVVGTETVGGQSAPPAGGQPQQIKPSPEEQKKSRILEAHRRELEEEIAHRRKERIQKFQQVSLIKEKKIEEEKQQEGMKKESMFQRGLALVTGRFKKRVETRLPKSA